MKILIADDLQSLLKCYQTCLKFENHIPFPAKNTSEALEIIKMVPIDLGIVDFDFEEEQNGIDLILESRKCGKKIPFILNTGMPGAAEDYIGRLSDPDRGLLSPLLMSIKINMGELREKIQEVFQK